MNELGGGATACPGCGGTVAPEIIAGRSPGVKFKSEQDGFFDLAGIPITSGFFNHSAPALRCPRCGTVVVPGPSIA